MVLRTRFLVSVLCGILLCVPAWSDIASVDFASDANNLTSGTVSAQRLPVGTSAQTVAAGDDIRFDSIAYGRPSENVDSTRVLVWVE